VERAFFPGAKKSKNGFKSRTFRPPAEVARIQTQRTLLDVAAAHTELVNALGAKLGVGWRTTRLVKSLLLQVRLAAARCTALVP
jgi:hypothetical protein